MSRSWVFFVKDLIRLCLGTGQFIFFNHWRCLKLSGTRPVLLFILSEVETKKMWVELGYGAMGEENWQQVGNQRERFFYTSFTRTQCFLKFTFSGKNLVWCTESNTNIDTGLDIFVADCKYPQSFALSSFLYWLIQKSHGKCLTLLTVVITRIYYSILIFLLPKIIEIVLTTRT